MIKRVFSVILCILCIAITIPTSYASSEIKATLVNEGTNIYITLSNDANEKIKVGVYRFALKYNKDTAKLIKITAVDGAKLEYSDNNGTVTAVYLNTSGFEVTEVAKKFIKLQFTKASYGIFSILNNEGANIDAEMLSIKLGGKLEISNSSISGVSNNLNGETQNNDNIKIPIVDTYSNTDNEFIENNNTNNIINIPATDNEDNEFKYFFLGILATLFVVGLTFTAYRFGISKAKREQEDKEENE